MGKSQRQSHVVHICWNPRCRKAAVKCRVASQANACQAGKVCKGIDTRGASLKVGQECQDSWHHAAPSIDQEAGVRRENAEKACT